MRQMLLHESSGQRIFAAAFRGQSLGAVLETGRVSGLALVRAEA
jgi:hypothetical protein